MSTSAHAAWARPLSVAVIAGALLASLPAPVIAAESPVATIKAAVAATKAAKSLQFTSTVTVSGVTSTATGRADLKGNRTALEATIGLTSSEFRRIGTTYYVDAARLGSTAQTWVRLEPLKAPGQLADSSVASFVTTLSPQRLLDSLTRATAATYVGMDTYGSHFAVTVQAPRTSTMPFIDFVGPLKPDPATEATIDVWIDAKKRVTRLATSGWDYSTLFALSNHGAAADVPVPPAASTGTLSSTSGRFVFGTGLVPKPIPGGYQVPSASPTTEFVDGVVRGNFHASSASGQPLRFDLVTTSHGGKMSVTDQNFTLLPYASWLDGEPKGDQTFEVHAREVTPASTYLASIPLIGMVADPVVGLLQDITETARPLAPIIGAALPMLISFGVGVYAPGDTPIAFTRRIDGYAGTPISANFFPASGQVAGELDPTVLQGSALGEPGNTDPYQEFDSASFTPGTGAFRESGYNVITWDPRGEFASGGKVQLDNPFFEARDVGAIINWAARDMPILLNGWGDPALGMVGGSYGGVIQLMTASTNWRVDAIVPSMTWSSLVGSLQPHGRLNVAAVSRLLSALNDPAIRVNPDIVRALREGVAAGELSDEGVTLLTTMDAEALLGQLQAPALLVQSTTDPIFPLGESLETAQGILSNPYGTPIKLAWLDAQTQDAAVRQLVSGTALAWIDKYVAGIPIPDAYTPTFQWWDQAGQRYVSALYPFDPGFNEPQPITAASAGGRLTITPTDVKPASRIEIPVKVPVGAQTVGAPSISFTYQGTGNARSLYVGIVDASVGTFRPMPTLVPITLDGKQRTVSIPLSDIAYTGRSNGQLVVSLRGYADGMTANESGQITLSNVEVALAIRSPT